jgi:hypothetical protein
MQHRLSRAAVFVSVVLLPLPAVASPIYWQLNGEITYNPTNPPGSPYEELDSLLPVGTQMTFLITVDPAAPDLCDDPGAGFYFLPGATVSFGGKSYATAPGYSWIEVNNVLANCAESGFHDALLRLFFPFGLTTIDIAAGPGDALPTTPPSTGGFWVGSFDPHCCDEDLPPFDAFGGIDSGVVVPAPVPEPSTFLLLVSGLAAIAARRRRSR